MTAPTIRCMHFTAEWSRCTSPATHNIRCGDSVLLKQPYSNPDGTRPPLALCEKHALEFMELNAAPDLHWTMEPIWEENHD